METRYCLSVELRDLHPSIRPWRVLVPGAACVDGKPCRLLAALLPEKGTRDLRTR